LLHRFQYLLLLLQHNPLLFKLLLQHANGVTVGRRIHGQSTYGQGNSQRKYLQVPVHVVEFL
jgi:hypothetical protein